MKKRLPLLLLAILVLGIGATVGLYATYTVAAGERSDDFSGVSYGYEVSQSYLWNSASINIWLTRGIHRQMDADFYLRRFSIEKVEEERWLSNGAAIYLSLRVKHHDSTTSVDTLKIIFDFHKGQMFTYSKFTLWRFWNERKTYESWISEPEFNEVLSSYSRSDEK